MWGECRNIIKGSERIQLCIIYPDIIYQKDTDHKPGCDCETKDNLEGLEQSPAALEVHLLQSHRHRRKVQDAYRFYGRVLGCMWNYNCRTAYR